MLLALLVAGVWAFELRRAGAGIIDANAPGSAVVFSRSSLPRDGDGRRLDGYSEIVLRGLCSVCETQVRLMLSARTPRRAIVIEKRSPTSTRRLADVPIGPEDQLVVARARSDRWGALRLLVRFDQDTAGATIRIRRLEVDQSAGRQALQRTLEIALLAIAVAMAIPGALAWRALGAGVTAIVALSGPPFIVHGHLPAALGVVTALVAWRYGARALRRLEGVRPRWASCIALAAVLKIWLAAMPSVVSLDAYFHAHKAFDFGRGAIMTSLAPGPKEALAVPYPPAVYALLWPCQRLFDLDEHDMAVLVRILLGTLEGLVAPLLLWALMRRDPEVAGAAMTLLAVMPAGLLVVAQGIVANAFGQSATLAALWALTRPVHPSIKIGLLAIALLSHLSSAACLASLLLIWWCWEWYETRDGTAFLRRISFLGAAAVLAFLLYYRELIALVLDAAHKIGHEGAVRLNRIMLGKLAQNLWLEYGAAPLALAALGLGELRRARPNERLLWYAWIATAVGMAIVGAWTLIVFRFDYFAAPLVAVLAALGAATARGRRWWGFVLAFTLATQILIALFLLLDRFEILAVLLYSPRWPFPFRVS